MKKIINGKKYDTETARKVAEFDDGLGWRDFNHVEMTLYKKKTGEFFLHGEGHGNTRFCSYDGNMRGTGERIEPMTEADARKWVESYDNDKYEDIFGECEE